MRGHYKCFNGKLTEIMTTHQNCCSEMVLMRGHNICFYGKLTEIIFELSSNIRTFVHGNVQNLNNKILQDIYGQFRYGNSVFECNDN